MPNRRGERPAEETEESRAVVGRALRRYVALNLVAFFVVGTLTVFASNLIAKDEALREARARGVGMASAVVAPFVNSAVRRQRPGADDELATMVLNRLREGSVKHVKLWREDGTVFWSDEEGLAGEHFDLARDVAALFGSTDTVVEFSELEKDENILDQADGPLLEVYVGTFDAQNKPFVFEAYMSEERVARDRSAILARLLPFGLVLLLLFQLIGLPLGFSLVGQVHRALAQRSRTTRLSLEAWHVQRRQLAQDLHDEVIPDLAGVAYVLPSLAQELPEDSPAREQAERVTTLIQQDIAALRSLVTDLFPRELEGSGLTAALEELAARARESGLETELVVAGVEDLDAESAGLVFRVAREGLRNAARHAQARTAVVHVSRLEPDHAVVVTVTDDGVGPGREVRPGHVGLRLLAQVLDDVGGNLLLRPGEAAGAELRATIPLDRPGTT